MPRREACAPCFQSTVGQASRLLAIMVAAAWANSRASAFIALNSKVRLNRERANRKPEIQVKFLTLQREAWDEPGVLDDGILIGLRDAGFDDLLSVIAGGA